MKTRLRLTLLCALGLITLFALGCAATGDMEVKKPEPPKLTDWQGGMATWYGQMYNGRRTASGQQFDMTKMTGAHATLPYGTRVELENPATGATAVVVINDRSHLKGDTVLAVSKAAAQKLGVFPAMHFAVNWRVLE